MQDDDAGVAPPPGASGGSAGSAAGSGTAGAQSMPVAGAPAMQPIAPPVTDDCITDVTPGDHSFSCGGVTFLVIVPEACTKLACGLIFDVHGGTMSGAQMRDNTHLHELAPQHGYLVVHPSATAENTGGSWDLRAHPPVMGQFMDRMIKAFHVDPKRIHVTGFSQGSGVTFWFLCNKPALLASAAPISGQSADQITGPDGMPCLPSIGENWKPRVPILFMSGTSDTALVIDGARARVEGLVMRLGLTGGDQIDGDATYRRKRWQSADGMVLDYIEHDYGGQAVLGGHCIPGGTDIAGSANNFGLNATTCTTPDRIALNWGQTALQWFRDNETR
jgi:pimeloyl-ACP methyl ester carboxylesterase